MIRPQWLPNAKAIFAIQSRFVSTSAPSAGFTYLPFPRRPHQNAGPREFADVRERTATASRLKSFNRTKTQDEKKPYSAAHHMLVIGGLPTSLRAADFYRLAGREGLSSYGNAISNTYKRPVAQDRDPWTFEPLGTYRVSFSTAAAAALYEAKLERLLRLAQFKMSNKAGSLWSSKVPREIRSTVPPAKELDDFTILPGSFQGLIRKERSRVKGKFAWQIVMDNIIQNSLFKVNSDT
ncbi:hypothetical protein FSARC_2660 [Fusarium sarcochroum]|uniref:Uncharacterized protein n=1 Tax=Fusarium sarcochroum TaxID=1208366 RepID=A0A8H4U662_9HYPO|nr:hypothetical protein FSARC_2660 [Fusarium sarcochroum]